MAEETSDSVLSFPGVGSITVLGGVICCMGLKLIGGAALFGGLAATVGLSTGLVTFLVGGVGGMLLAVIALRSRRLSVLQR
ncbi:MAG: hypothetical protein ABEJ05_08775 [Haloglomus sp.]